MQDGLKNRVLASARYIADTGATVRDTARRFGYSKSTVHKDMTERLCELDTDLYERVADVLRINKAERHIRGGIATHNKYKKETAHEQQ